MSKDIQVTRSYLPPYEEFESRIRSLWISGHLSNHGKNILEPEEGLKNHLEQEHLWAISKQMLCLPLFTQLQLDSDQFDRIVSIIKSILNCNA